MNTLSGWEGILDTDEAIRWQARPDGAVTWQTVTISKVLFGLVFSGFALFWMIMASQAGGMFWMFGLIHFCVGIGIGIAPLYWNAYRRRNSWYTLTNKRALIATDMPLQGRKIKSYPITKQTPLELEMLDLGSIYFATKMRHSKNRSYEVKIGFERITDAGHVFSLMRDIQKETA